ncbi:MAG: tetraacyldisaccharide 4'-kinase, partial [Odoribacter sp.]|nr:tetraacyldisaccharide 4'-kinase [Odoribacter sp.]
QDIKPIDYNIITKRLNLYPYQQLFFTTLKYGAIRKLSDRTSCSIEPDKDSGILCITGIAQPKPYIKHLKTFTSQITELCYPDHHHFTKNDIQHIEKKFREIKNEKKYIFTTEKDAVRLQACNLPEDLKQKIYYIPVEPAFIKDDGSFLNEISEYVRKNQK